MWVDPPQELFNDTEIRIRCAAILTTTLMHDYAAHERHMHGIVETIEAGPAGASSEKDWERWWWWWYLWWW